jgi:RimJ/RimL family protein N-acetyltransferase
MRWFANQAEDPTISMFGIFNCDVLVGVCGFTDISHVNRRAEFSLYIGLEYQRMGYGIQALKTLFHHGYGDLNLKVIWGETLETNPALHCFEKLGMQIEGVRREFYYKDGEYLDAILISMTREEFSNELVRWEGAYDGDSTSDIGANLGPWDRLLCRIKAFAGSPKNEDRASMAGRTGC